MTDRLTFIWTVLVALFTTMIGLVVNYAVSPRWIAPTIMLAVMIALASYGRIRRKDRG